MVLSDKHHIQNCSPQSKKSLSFLCDWEGARLSATHTASGFEAVGFVNYFCLREFFEVLHSQFYKIMIGKQLSLCKHQW